MLLVERGRRVDHGQPARRLPVRAPALSGRTSCSRRDRTPMTDETAPRELVRLASADNFRDVAGTGAGLPDRGRRGACDAASSSAPTSSSSPTVDAETLTGLGDHPIHDLRGTDGDRGTPRRRRSPARPGTTSRSPASRWSWSPASTTSTAARARDAAGLRRVRPRTPRRGRRTPSCSPSSRPAPCRSSSTAPPARTAPAGPPRCCSRSRASTGRRSWPTTCSPTSSPRRPAEKYLALIAEHLGADKVAVYEPAMIVEESYLPDGVRRGRRALRLGRRLPARRARTRRRPRGQAAVPTGRLSRTS